MKRNWNISRQVSRQRKRWLARRPRRCASPARSWGQFEQLEDRSLLSANPLATFEGQFDNTDITDDVQSLTLTVENNSAGANLSLFMQAIDGSVDPAPLVLQTEAGDPVPPLISLPDAGGGNGSFLLTRLLPGNYTIMASAGTGAVGRYKIDAYLLGDINGDGQVDSQEFLATTAGVVQDQFGGNQVTAQFFRQQGIDFSQDLYRIGSDANLNGVMDKLDLDKIQENLGIGRLELNIFDDLDPPVVVVALEQDTGNAVFEGSLTDGITSQFSVTGTVTDKNDVVSFRVALDDNPSQDKLNNLDGSGNFTLSESAIRLLQGGSSLDDGPHTLTFTAGDENGNVGTTPFSFVFDRFTPAPPTNLDLVDTSDSGLSSTDNNTSATMPLISVDAEPGTFIQIFRSGETDVRGEGLSGSGPIAITQPLPEGPVAVRAQAIDAAGNVSGLSDSLILIIDLTAPATPDFDLDPPAVDQDQNGNPLVPDPMVDLVNVAATDADALVDLQLSGATIDTVRADGSGNFSFAGVDLGTPFGQVTLTALATDLAGNQSTFDRQIVVDQAPFVSQTLGPIEVDQDRNTVEQVDISGLFGDPNLNDGDSLTLEIVNNSDPGLLMPQLTGPDGGPLDTLEVNIGDNLEGTGTLTLRATDTFGLSVTSDIDFNVIRINDAPTVTAPTALGVDEDQDLSLAVIDVDDVDVDPDSEILDVDLTVDNGVLNFNTVGLTSSAGDGTGMVELSGTLNALNAALDTLVYRPDTDFNGPATLDITVDDNGNTGDGGPLSDNATIDITVSAVNDAPVLSTPAMASATEEVEMSIPGITVSDVDVDEGTGELLMTLSAAHGTLDVGDTSALSSASGEGTAMLNLQGTVADLNTVLDTLTYLGDANFSGTDTIDLAVDDLGNTGSPGAQTDQATIMVDVANTPDDPMAEPDAFQAAHNRPTTLPDVLTNDTDPDLGDTLSIFDFDATSAEGGQVTLLDGIFTYDPNGKFDTLPPGGTGVDSFTYTIEDTTGRTSTTTVTLTIVSNQAPIAADDAAATDEATAIDIDVVADNGNGPDTDPDGDDSLLMVTGVGSARANLDGSSTLGATVTINGDGTVHYDPSKSATLKALSPGEAPLVDTFFYEITDEAGVTATGMVEVTVTGLNDAPEIAPQTFSIVENSANGTVVDTVAASDPNGDGFTFEITGGTGKDAFAIDPASGEITVADGTLLDFETAPSLTLDVRVTDDDPMALSASATMTINVLDMSEGPTVVNPIDDLALSDVDAANPPDPGPQPGPIDLTTVFFDPDSALDFEIVSNTNPDLVSATVLGGQLEVSFIPFSSSQDRSPAMVTVKATEVGGAGLEVTDTFMVSVAPQTTFEAHLVVLAEPSAPVGPSFDFQTEVLPTSLTSVTVGETYVLEIYVKDLLVPDIIAGNDFTTGVSGAFFDVTYNDAIVADVTAADLSHTIPFNSKPDTADNLDTDGVIAQFGGLGVAENFGVSPNFARLGFIEFTATSAGLQEFEISFDGISTAVGRGGSLGVIADDIDPSQAEIFNVSVMQVDGGAPLLADAGAETAALDSAGVTMTLTREPTALGADSQVAVLPQSETSIDEWDSYWVELWVNTREAGGVRSGMVDLVYDTRYSTATQIDHGSVFNSATSGSIDDAAGLVSDLGGSTTRSAVGTDGFVLLGRVKFEPTSGDQVPVDIENQFLGPYDLGLELAGAQLDVAGSGSVDAALGEAPNTQLWAVVYDVDDNDQIDFGDFAYFADSFLDDTLASDSPYAAALDFNKSGRVDFGDFAYLSSNFLASKASGIDVLFPENFQQTWIGSALDVEGSTSVDQLLTAAVDTWQQALGDSEPVDVQLVVQDFGNSRLGEGQILEVDADGQPVRGQVTIDDDANGLGWYSGLAAPSDTGHYDLYTVLLHEVGHVLGFTPAYEGFASLVQSDGSGGVLFVGSDFSALLDAASEHLDTGAHPGDVMNATLSADVRKLPSALDVKILEAAHDAAAAGARGFSSDAAALHDGEQAVQIVSMAEKSDLEAGIVFDGPPISAAGASLRTPVQGNFGAMESSEVSTHNAQIGASLSGIQANRRAHHEEVFGDVNLLETFRSDDAHEDLLSALSAEPKGGGDSLAQDTVFAAWDELRF